MIIECVRCGASLELRRSKRGNNLSPYLALKKQVQNTFLKGCPELCPDCLKELADWATSPAVIRQRDVRTRVRYGRDA